MWAMLKSQRLVKSVGKRSSAEARTFAACRAPRLSVWIAPPRSGKMQLSAVVIGDAVLALAEPEIRHRQASHVGAQAVVDRRALLAEHADDVLVEADRSIDLAVLEEVLGQLHFQVDDLHGGVLAGKPGEQLLQLADLRLAEERGLRRLQALVQRLEHLSLAIPGLDFDGRLGDRVTRWLGMVDFISARWEGEHGGEDRDQGNHRPASWGFSFAAGRSYDHPSV
jgi:hypothetical protein